MEAERKVKARLQWVQLYQKTGNASLVCRRCGISDCASNDCGIGKVELS